MPSSPTPLRSPLMPAEPSMALTGLVQALVLKVDDRKVNARPAKERAIIKALEHAFAQGADPNAWMAGGQNILPQPVRPLAFFLIGYRNRTMLRLCLEAGLDPNGCTPDGGTLLGTLSGYLRGDHRPFQALIEELLTAGADPNALHEGWHPTHYALGCMDWQRRPLMPRADYWSMRTEHRDKLMAFGHTGRWQTVPTEVLEAPLTTQWLAWDAPGAQAWRRRMPPNAALEAAEHTQSLWAAARVYVRRSEGDLNHPVVRVLHQTLQDGGDWGQARWAQFVHHFAPVGERTARLREALGTPEAATLWLLDLLRRCARPAFIEEALELGANPQARQSTGFSAAHLALVRLGDFELAPPDWAVAGLKHLIDAGADLTQREPYGGTALDWLTHTAWSMAEVGEMAAPYQELLDYWQASDLAQRLRHTLPTATADRSRRL